MRYLVVANQTLDSESLWQVMHQDDQRTTATFHLLVPPTPTDAQSDHVADPVGVAGERLSQAIKRFRSQGLTVTGEVGVADPWEAIGQAFAADSCDRVIIATLPHRASRWAHMDLPHRVARRWHVLVEWLTVPEGPDTPATVATIKPEPPRARV